MTSSAPLRIVRRCSPGLIEGVGPRYCPSVEDKVARFASKSTHQIFVEPEGLKHPRDLSERHLHVRLPFDVQYEFVRTIKGFERAHITRPRLLPSNTIFFDPRDSAQHAAKQVHLRPVSGGSDQRHDRLRRSGRSRIAGGRETPRCVRWVATLGRHCEARPTSACWSTISSRAVHPSRIACSPAVPNTG